jgi:hypothetical protein
MSENEKLDCILNYLSKEYNKQGKTDFNIAHGFRSKNEIAEAVFAAEKSGALYEMDLILNFLLEREEYLEEMVHGVDKFYRILWTGKVFIENGGYCSRYDSENRENAWGKRAETYTAYGALIAAIFAGLYFVWSVVSFCYARHCFCR